MNEKDMDPGELKKKLLLPHLEFVEMMLVKVRGSDLEQKWNTLHEIIISDKKRPSYEKIKKLESTLIGLRNESNQKNNTSTRNEPKANSNQIPKASASNENSIASSIQPRAFEEERDPRRRAKIDANLPQTIYKVKPQDPPLPKQTFIEHRKNENHKFSNNTERYKKQATEYSRNYNRKPFPHKKVNNPKFWDRSRHSSVFPERVRPSDNRDDSYSKRKRSESPSVHRSHNMPKRRFSCYDSRDKEDTEKGKRDELPEKSNRHMSSEKDVTRERSKTERIKRDELPEKSKKNESTERDKNSPSDLKIKESIEPSTSRATSKSNEKVILSKETIVVNDKSSAPAKTKVNTIDSIPLSNAMKKIQSFKIPKLNAVKNTEEETTISKELEAAEIPCETDLDIQSNEYEVLDETFDEDESEVIENSSNDDCQKMETDQLEKSDEKEEVSSSIEPTKSSEPETTEVSLSESKTEQKDEAPSTSSKPIIANKAASILTNLLDGEDENPEKMLEGLISALGSDKIEKMKELLLKKTLKADEGKVEETVLIHDAEKEGKSVGDPANDESVDDSNPKVNNKEIDSATTTSEQPHSENIAEEPTSSNISPTKSSPSPTKKVQKRKARKKLSELDRLHRDILTAHDHEGIFRACMQPRVSIKTKVFQSGVPDHVPPEAHHEIKTPEVKPCMLKLIKLELTRDEMPVIINEEFVQQYLTMSEPKVNSELKSKPGPKSKKIYFASKPLPLLKQKEEVKTEPMKTTVVNEVKEEPVQQVNVSLESKIAPKIKSGKLVTKKKRKNLLWSKGILKKKAKKFMQLRLAEWEDIESSDESVDFERTMKLTKFNDLFKDFASKYGLKMDVKKKVKKSSKESIVDDDENIVENNDTTSEAVSTEELPKTDENVQKDSNKEENTKNLSIPKKIMLPFDKNMLTMISKNCSSTESKSVTTSSEAEKLEAKPGITIKLPTKQITETATLPTVGDSEYEKLLNSVQYPKIIIDQNAKSLPFKPKVVMVKPIARENPEALKVRSLSLQEQEELVAKLSKISSPNATTGSTVDLSKLANTSLSISKVNVSKNSSINQSSTESTPTISNVLHSCDEQMVHKIIPSTATSLKTNNQELVKINAAKEANESFNIKIEPLVSEPSTSNEVSVAELPQEISSNSSESDGVEIVDLIGDDVDEDFVDTMRPWIEKAEFKCKKDKIESSKMISNVHCLASLFKCMGSTCSYYTNDRELFLRHLKLHQTYQIGDSLNFFLCCYCSFRSNNNHLLVGHIENHHGYAKFGCRYCFYRSVNEYQVTANHHTNFHRNKEKCVIVFESKKYKSENIEKNYISETLPKVCPALPCPYCRTGIYPVTQYENHLLSHKEMYITVCSKCNKQTNRQNMVQHLFKCFNKFGNYQCVFCVFGTCNFGLIDSHLATEHPDKMSYFAERTANFAKDITSVESLTIKELSKKITGNVKKILLRHPFNSKIYQNTNNFGRLSEELQFPIKENDQDTFFRVTERSASEDKSSLLIGEVMSLHD